MAIEEDDSGEDDNESEDKDKDKKMIDEYEIPKK